VPRAIVLLPAPTPLAIRQYRCASAPTRDLMILLPGIGDLMEDYEFSGFIEAVMRTGAPADLIVVDAHFGYYLRRTVLERLRQDVVAPARAAGYDRVWLVGISLGGLGAALYATEHAGDLEGLVLLAPFLGNQALLREIAEAGGLRHWQPGEEREDDYQRRLWRWLKRHATPGEKLPALVLGYGDRDQFAPAGRLLAEALPADRVFIVPGRHDWRTWKRLWDALLAARCLPGSTWSRLG
jgi:pimeloyl-ACP methyl ester carboxylesterase